MAISANRFKTLESDLDGIGTADFKTISDTDVRNIDIEPSVVITPVVYTKTQEELKSATSILPDTKTSAISALRLAKNNQLTATNLKNLATADKDKIIDTTLGKFTAVKGLSRALGPGCFSKIFGNKGAARGYRARAGGKNARVGECGVQELAGLVDKLGGTQTGLSITNTGVEKDFIAGVSKRSAEVGLPGTFTALSGLITDRNARKSAGFDVLMAGVVRQDMWVIKDVANSEVGPELINDTPNLSRQIMANYKTPEEISDREYVGYVDSFKGDMTKLDPEFMKAKTPSASLVASSKDMVGDYKEMLRMGNTLSVESSSTSPGVAPTLTNENLVYGGVALNMPDTQTSLDASYKELKYLPQSNVYRDRVEYREYNMDESGALSLVG